MRPLLATLLKPRQLQKGNGWSDLNPHKNSNFALNPTDNRNRYGCALSKI
ncbi:MAG: hypothetical protein HYS22_08020 [Deltaproteobacteria bacterium]|nr:hypothetical protein [Deltaproteobacteria bacterium]